MAGLRPPRVPDKPVPVFTGTELKRLQRACAGRGFQDRRDAAVIAVTVSRSVAVCLMIPARDPPLWRRTELSISIDQAIPN
jgi:integrase/recombinase XerD